MAAEPPTSSAVRDGLVWLFRRVIGVYFREVEVTGNLPAADTAGRVFVSNHTNGLVDAVLVVTTARCRISPIAKSTLWNIPWLRWLLDHAGAVPIVRRRDDPTKQAASNDAIFDTIAEALAGGSNILIFPEGTSHNEPRLIEVKSGAARMLARAHERGARGLTFQAVALEFDERNVFRSRSLLVYGPVRAVDDLEGPLVTMGGAQGPPQTPLITMGGAQGPPQTPLINAITAQIRDDLVELLVEGTTWPERRLIARVAEMLANDTGDRSLSGWSSVGRRVEAARQALRGVDEPTVDRVERAVGRYYDRLEEEGLADVQLASDLTPAVVDTLTDAALVLSLPLAVAGVVLYAVPYQLTRLAAQRITDEIDEVSTYKIGVGLLAYPVWAASLTGAGFALLPLPLGAGFAAVVFTSPFAALAWHDAAPRLRRAVRFFLSSRAHEGRVAELRALRAEAMALVAETRSHLGM